LNRARKTDLRSVSRTSQCVGFAAFLVFFGCESLQSVIANGDTRTISFHHVHTGEDLTITYKRDGRYDEAAMQKINWELRDWRREEPIKMDPHLIDLVWEVHRELGSKVPIQIICGYRAPATNAMLRAKSRGVAQFSQHMLGKAMDFYMPDVPLEKVREVGLQLQRGGVGFYPTSGSPFVHLDTGNVRHWPKVSRQYLAKIFPDGKTVHIPSDGRPMPGYKLALAEIKSRGSDNVSSISVASAAETAPMADSASVKKFFAKLFGKKDESGDDEESQITTVASRPVPETSEPATTASIKTAAVTPAPLPRPRPKQQPVQVASLSDRAPLPSVITGKNEQDSLALGYAASEPLLPRAAPAQPAPKPAARVRASVPVPAAAPETTARITQTADAAIAPASLFSNRMIQDTAEMHEPNPQSAMSLAAPVRTALRAEFAVAPEQPALSRFAGPAVVALPTVFFGQSAMLAPSKLSRVD
jgi:uncharacterized protein YcbK (DUF882 family)